MCVQNSRSMAREHTGIGDVLLSCSQDKIVKIDKATNSVIHISTT